MGDPRANATAAVLCTDLVGSTELLVGLGETAFDEFRRSHFEILRWALAGHGGQEIKTMGDGMLAVFSSAAEALSCAVAMQQAVNRPTATGGAPAGMRVGLALGDVIFEDEDVFGTPVVQAARLTAAAGSGQILAAAVVPAIAGGRSTTICTDLEPMALKGLPEPLPVCEVRWEQLPASAAQESGSGIGVLGSIVVVRDGVAAPLRSAQQRLLLAILVAGEGRVVTSDELVEALWGDGLPTDPSAALQTQVSRLRRTLGPAAPWLQTMGSAGYRLVVDPEHLDAARFAHLVARARGAVTAPAAALRDVETALELWRGRAYLEVADHEALRVAANGLAEQQADAAELRAELLIALGRAGEAARAMEVLSLEHPFREHPVALRMRALARDGRHAEALSVFEEFRRHLEEELGLDPSPELCGVQDEVLRPEPVPPARAAAALALPGNSFVGRERDLAAVTESLQRARLVTLTGPGGMGKTRLALHSASALALRYPDGVWVCELAALTEPDAVPAAVAAALGITEWVGRSPTERIIEFVAAKALLLVVDNCEHVLAEAAALVGAVLAAAPEVAILATSRERLGVAGEQRWPLDALPTPVGDDLASPAVALFADRAAAIRPDFILTGEDLGAVCELCRLLDGLPLAIELAAARTLSRSVGEIVAELTGRLSGLTDRRRPIDRHRSIAAVVGWSYDLLEPGERAICEFLAVFAGGFTAEAAAAVIDVDLDDLLDDLTALVEQSLLRVHRSAGRTRYSMLEPIRQVAETRLRDRGMLERTRARHATWAVNWVETADAGLRGPDEASWVVGFATEFANLRAAHAWNLEHDPEAAVRFVGALYIYSCWYGPSEVFTWADRTVERHAGIAHPSLAAAFATAAAGTWRRGDLDLARTLAERGIGLVPPAEPSCARFAWDILGDIEMMVGDYPRAIASYDRAVAQHGEVGDQALVTTSVVGRALALAYAGDTERARAEVATAASSVGAAECPTSRALCDYAGGEIRLEDAPEEALVLLRRSAALARQVGNEFLAGIAGLSAISCAARHGDPADALTGYADLIDHWQRIGAWYQQWITLRTLIETLSRLGRYEPAAVLHGALTVSPTAPPLIGLDAERIADAVTAMHASLGQEEFTLLQADGAALGDERAVAYALRCVVPSAAA